jgi:hypothetical protein
LQIAFQLDQRQFRRIRDQLLDLHVLAEAELEQQNAVGFEVRGRLLDQAADDREAVVLREDGNGWFVIADFGLETDTIALANIGWVRHDQVEGPVDIAKQVRQDEADAACDPETLPIPPGDVQSFGGYVGGDKGGPRAFVRQRHSQTAAAGADIRYRQRGVAIRKQLERGFDDQLRFGARNKDRRRDFERQIPELLATGDIGDGLASRPAGDERVVIVGEAGRRRVAGGCEELRGVPAEQPLRQQPRVEAGFGVLDASVAQSRARAVDESMNRVQETAVASFSFSD